MDKIQDEAVVLLNMGGPNNLYEVELFLKNMFNDPLILQISNNFIRKMVASVITNSRLETAKRNYKHIGSKSPLVEITLELTKTLQKLDSTRFYTYAMRYTPPFSDMVIRELIDKNIKKITLFSMYPQYSRTTTLSSIRDFMDSLRKLDYKADIKVVENYPTDSGFIESCVEQISQKIQEQSTNPSEFVLLLSAHSIPQSMIDAGDPYKSEIEKSADCIKKSLNDMNLCFKDIQISYQSKLGPIKWLEPSTIDLIKKYKNDKIIIYPLAFSIDNSETDFELEIENRKLADSLGVRKYIVCKCPNSSTTFARAIINLINKQGKSINETTI